MRMSSMARAAALVALVCVVAVPMATAAKGNKKGKKNAVIRPVVGTIGEISDKQFTMTVRKAKATKKQAGVAGGETLTVSLEDTTKYRELAHGTDQDVVAGVHVALLGTTTDDKLAARALVTYKPDAGEDPMVSEGAIRMAGPGLAQLARRQKGEKMTASFGVVESVNPLVVKVRVKGGDKSMTVTPDANAVYFKLGLIEKTALQSGRTVAVMPTERVTAGANTVIAASVLQFPQAQGKAKKGKKGAFGGAPVQ